jgi:hypothetical protein
MWHVLSLFCCCLDLFSPDSLAAPAQSSSRSKHLFHKSTLHSDTCIATAPHCSRCNRKKSIQASHLKLTVEGQSHDPAEGNLNQNLLLPAATFLRRFDRSLHAKQGSTTQYQSDGEEDKLRICRSIERTAAVRANHAIRFAWSLIKA